MKYHIEMDFYNNGKKEFKEMVVNLLDGEIERPDITHIAQSLLWESQLKSWNIEENFVDMARKTFDK